MVYGRSVKKGRSVSYKLDMMRRRSTPSLVYCWRCLRCACQKWAEVDRSSPHFNSERGMEMSNVRGICLTDLGLVYIYVCMRARATAIEAIRRVYYLLKCVLSAAMLCMYSVLLCCTPYLFTPYSVLRRLRISPTTLLLPWSYSVCV